MDRPHYRRTASGQTVLVGDGMQNVMTGLGGPSDKGGSNRHMLQILSDYELAVVYESSWVGRQIVDIPASDATKKWRTWSGDKADEIADLEDAFGLQRKVEQAAQSGRLFGGAAIIVGAGGEDASEPLDYSQVTEIRYINVLDRFDLAPGPISRDVTSTIFGRPEYYTAQIGGRLHRIHPSRLSIFGGARPSSRAWSAALAGWDMSILTHKIDAIRDIDAVTAHIRSLVSEAKIDVIKTPGLTHRVQDPREEEALKKQLQMVQETIGNRRKMLLDSEEDLVSSSYSFSGMADMFDRFMHMAAGAADIPVTRLFGASPGGLNATGEADLANYYDNVTALQRNVYGPALRNVDMCLKASVGALDDMDTSPTWRPVREMSERDLAEVQDRTVSAILKLAQSSIFADVDVEAVAINAMRRVGLNGIEEGA